jgi:hypothetical protein
MYSQLIITFGFGSIFFVLREFNRLNNCQLLSMNSVPCSGSFSFVWFWPSMVDEYCTGQAGVVNRSVGTVAGYRLNGRGSISGRGRFFFSS